MVILQFFKDMLELQFTSQMATTWHNPTKAEKVLWKTEHNLEQNSAWRAPCPKEPNKTFPLALLIPVQEEPSGREAVSVTASFAESVKLFGDMTPVLALGFPTEDSIKNYPLQGPNIFTLNLSESLKSTQPIIQQTSIWYIQSKVPFATAQQPHKLLKHKVIVQTLFCKAEVPGTEKNFSTCLSLSTNWNAWLNRNGLRNYAND